jgi:hypothetical protein
LYRNKNEEANTRKTEREDSDGIDVTELVVSNRDSKTGKRFKVFSTIISHPYGTGC